MLTVEAKRDYFILKISRYRDRDGRKQFLDFNRNTTHHRADLGRKNVTTGFQMR